MVRQVTERGALLVALIAGLTVAATPGSAAQTVQQCLKQAFMLASDARVQSLPPASKQAFKQKLSLLEDACDRKRFDEAERVRVELERLMGR